jgi:aminoglycoside 3-N-acetyltransferase
MGERPENHRTVTDRQILDGLRSLGVAPADLLLVHSALSSLGHVVGGAGAVVRALCEAVAPGGTVFVPTFSYGQVPYDPNQAPSLTGAVTEWFRRLPGAIRSLHPTHSFAGSGPHASAILADHDKVHPFGRGSPLWRLLEQNAKVLLIGCDHRSSSMVHVAEEILDLPYIHRTRQVQVMEPGGIRLVTVRRPGCSKSFNRIDSQLRRRQLILEGQIGESRLMLMEAQSIVATVTEILRSDPAALLCGGGQCTICDESRCMLEEHARH